MPETPAAAPMLQQTLHQPPAEPAPQRPLARLVRNPNPLQGLPPFALADQAGKIQRYIEPVPGIDLLPYLDQVVVVRHDTGRTLLATQLELPPQPLHPLAENAPHSGLPLAQRSAPGPLKRLSDHGAFVKRAQFVDDDDTTVQLLPDSEGQASDKQSALLKETAESTDSGEHAVSDGELPTFPGQMLPGDEYVEETVVDPMSAGPADGYPHALEAFSDDFHGMQACPECGGYHAASECGPFIGHAYGGSFHSRKPEPATLFADFEINFLRTHLPETSAGKLSEKYEFSPRVIVGFRDTGKADGRLRYWSYDRDTAVLGGTPIRVDFDVFDVEGTHSFVGRRSEVTIGAGFRLAAIDFIDDQGRRAGADMIGMTLSAEGRAPLAKVHGCSIAGFYGGRLSLLGGDWGGDPGNDFTGGLVQDDNVVVHELQAGFDIATRYRKSNLHARLGFEIQNWHSDAFSQNAGTDSIGFLGPGIQLGAEF